MGEKARTLGLLLAAGGAYALWQQLPLEQALNAFISVLVFNIIYDLLIRWGAGVRTVSIGVNLALLFMSVCVIESRRRAY